MYLRQLFLLLTALLVSLPDTAQAQQSVARQWNEELLAAIRRNVPNPPAHARNLHHTAVAMYDGWTAYDATAVGYLYNEKANPMPSTSTAIEIARDETISYAAYRVLRSRFASGAGAATSLQSFRDRMTALGYSYTTAEAAITSAQTPAELGKRIGQAILNWGAVDGFSQTSYPQAYTNAVNPNIDPVPLSNPFDSKAISVLGNNGEFPSRANMPLGVGLPTGTDPNYWQPLALSASVSQNGIPLPGGIQTFVGVQSLATVPFSLTRSDPTKPWIDPGPPSRLARPGQPSSSDATYKSTFMDVVRKTAHLNDTNLVNISPGAYGNNPLGTDNGTGHPVNPITGLPYPANNVVHGDFARVLAEYWADGPNSETPPGHWHVLANEVADNPLTVKRIGGAGPVVSNLEWDVKTYFSLSGAVHNAACAAWSLKRYYSGTRPITAIRYMCSQGQSSDPGLPSYNSEGIPLETDLTEVITNTTAASGGKHEQIWDVYTNSYHPGAWHIGEIAVKGWPGEHMDNLAAPSIATHQSTVRWMLGKDWVPFQRKTFNTPAFPGYVSGHSTFSRSSAEVLALITGSPYFPGGFEHHTIAANSMQIDLGPSAPVDLQWATYYDAADQAGQSRRYGGIHPPEDDLPARTIGSQAGISAYEKAVQFWSGSIQTTDLQPLVTVQANGSALITWPATKWMFHRVQKSTDYSNWTDANSNEFAYSTSQSFTDTGYTPGTVYRIIQTEPNVARIWNEQLLDAIRIDTPHPPKHARNIHHLATVMYDAWAAYDTTAIGYIHHERATATDIPAARKEAISYAAYRLLKSRFSTGPGATATNAALDAQMDSYGYNKAYTATNGTTPADLGNRIATSILAWGLADGSGQALSYNDPTYINPQPPMVVLQSGIVRGFGIPSGTNPNLWQPLAFDAAFTQNGIAADLVQKYVGVTWLAAAPFSLRRTDNTKPWIDLGPPSALFTGTPGTATPAQIASDAEYKAGALYVLQASAALNSTATIDMSPAAQGNSTLGADDGTGYAVNPYTGQPYAHNYVQFGDYARVMAEYWADGPHSETPPGHWQKISNEVSDNPLTIKRIGGTGPIVDDLEWNVKNYFAVGGATHDAACAAWAVKRYYQGTRPITAIRHMATLGQSTDPGQASYHPQGLPLQDGVVEVATTASLSSGGRHFGTPNAGPSDILVYSWPGEPTDPATQTSPVRWMRGMDWVPYQRKTFNTPAFPGYVSGHSTFSRAAAEAMTAITGTPYYPGGLGTFTASANTYLVFERGPTATTQLQWATYYDAADLAGNSRRWGGIHIHEDDYDGRIMGSLAGKSAYALAKKYWDGSVETEVIVPSMAFQPNGSATLTTPVRRGMYHTIQCSYDLVNWTTLVPRAQSNASYISYNDPNPTLPRKFYRVLFEPAAQ